ncbi:MAG: hypothetical protein ABIG84_03015 [archaeon]
MMMSCITKMKIKLKRKDTTRPRAGLIIEIIPPIMFVKKARVMNAPKTVRMYGFAYSKLLFKESSFLCLYCV